MDAVQTLVVGGGPSGLSVAYGLQGNTLVIEKEPDVGGLCRSLKRGEGIFDIGGHSFHTPYPEVHDLVETILDDGLYRQQRDARVFTHGVLIPYPFQKSYERVPDPNVVRECEDGLRAAAASPQEAANFEEYIVAKFGKGIADHFMLPYNRKLWARDIKRISCEWTSERVAAPKGQTETFKLDGGQRKPLQADTQVGYPRSGGFEEIFRALAERVPSVQRNTEVVDIDPLRRIACTNHGQAIRWETLVSTMPLPLLLRIIRGTPDSLHCLAARLEHMSLRVELLLTGRPLKTPVQRIYVADPAIPPHKIALNHNSSDFLRQRSNHAIMAEVSVSKEKPVSADRIAPDTIAFLRSIGVLETTDEIVWTGHYDVKYAYPVYTHDRPAVVREIKDWLAERNIYTTGRFGDWEYINSDKCVMKGLRLADELRSLHPIRETGDLSAVQA